MTSAASTIGGGNAGEFQRAWEAVRENGEIQFEPVKLPQAASQENSWLSRFFEWLGDLLEPFAQLLGLSAPVLWWILLGLIAALVLYLLWKLLAPIARLRWEKRVSVADEEEIDWTPERSEALALLGDADRLAAEGRYDEATHLLLLRSVNQIVNVRPEWLDPSSTAREIASLPELPDKARTAFTVISERVERSLFALRRLDRADWETARSAYADFALADLRPGALAA